MTNEARPVSAFDFGALGSLKAQAVNDPGKNDAAKKAAQQFEAIFLQMMLKSMRDASPKGGLFESQSTKTFEQMYDQQIAMAMSQRGSTGIAEMVEKFITRSMGGNASTEPGQFLDLNGPKPTGLPLIDKSDPLRIPEGSTTEFFRFRERFGLGGTD